MKINYIKILFGIAITGFIPLLTIYLWSSHIMNRTFDLPVPYTSLHIPTDTASIREGARLVRIAHCNDCHGAQFTGRVYRELKYMTKLVTPNVTQILPSYTNEELDMLIRHGIKKNKKSVFFMPSKMFYELKDSSVAKIIAYLRTLKPLPNPEDLPSGHTLSPIGRLEIIRALYMPEKLFFKAHADRIDHTAPQKYAHHDTTQFAFGQYLAMTTCSSCHGSALTGNPAGTTPNLVIAHAYTKKQFVHLLKTGEGALGRKNLGLMSVMARDHFRYLNENEMNAIYHFLITRGREPKPSTSPSDQNR